MSKRAWIIFGVLVAVGLTLDWVFGTGGHVCQATILSGVLGAQSQSHTAEAQNRENRRQADVNLILSMMSRGMPMDSATLRRMGLRKEMADAIAGRASSILPYYMNDAEKNLGTNAADAAQFLQSMGGGAQGQASELERQLAQYGEGDSANTMFANDIATGREGQRMIDENAPVQEARMGVATGKRSAALESLKQTLNDIDAIQSKKGYQGDSVGGRMMQFNARKNIGVASAADIGGARLQNATELAAIQQAGRGMKLANVNLGDTLARSQAGRTNLATNTIGDRYRASMAPLSFFNLGPHDSNPYNANQQAVPGMGEFLARGAGSAGSSLLNSYLQRLSRGNPPQNGRGATDQTLGYNGGAASQYEGSGDYSTAGGSAAGDYGAGFGSDYSGYA